MTMTQVGRHWPSPLHPQILLAASQRLPISIYINFHIPLIFSSPSHHSRLLKNNIFQSLPNQSSQLPNPQPHTHRPKCNSHSQPSFSPLRQQRPLSPCQPPSSQTSKSVTQSRSANPASEYAGSSRIRTACVWIPISPILAVGGLCTQACALGGIISSAVSTKVSDWQRLYGT